ncbi:MAG: hypothetical protein QGI83_23395 [Candidatus Latescibacteria bacterium]|nr:hypothetical protein [Candidatus Latescibacterota bacterium]
MATEPVVRHLFVDDGVVQEMEGLCRTLHQPEKQGPVLKAEDPWEGLYIGCFSPPMWIPEEGVYKQVYECRYDRAPGKETHRYALAVSRDGLAWEKPDLGLVDFEGARRNNLFPTPDDRRLVHVVHDPDETDPSRRYKGLLTVPKGRVPVVSADGLHWEKLDTQLPSGDAGTMAFHREKRLFMAMLKRPNPNTVGRSYDVSYSTDFIEWSEPRFIFGMDRERDQEMALDVIRRRRADPALAKPLFIDPDPATGWQHPEGESHTPTWQCECYNFGVVPYEGLYLGLITVYYPTGQRLPERSNADGFNLIQLAVSRDLESWERLGDRQPFLETSPLTEGLVGSYDRLQLGAYNGIVLHEDEVRLYYNGMKCRAPQHDRWTDGTPRHPSTLSASEQADWLEDTHSAMCLATLRRDGFVSLDADEAGGYVLTKPLELEGSGLFLNLDAAQGVARVELLDEACGPIEGFAGDDAAEVSGDGIRVPVVWPSGADLSAMVGRSVRLKIHLRNAKLYAFWSE